MTSERAYKRIRHAADRIGENALDRHRFLEKSVLLTGDSEILDTYNGFECFKDCLRLLTRISQKVSVDTSNLNEAQKVETKSLSRHLSFTGPVRILENPTMKDFNAILGVGTSIKEGYPYTVINSNGWLLRASSTSTEISGKCDNDNPIGALAAASVGTAEIFKRLIRIKPEKASFQDGSTFSLFTYKSNIDDPGPSIPTSINLNLAQIGVGAIGNGFIHLLSELPIAGTLSIVDYQKFEVENLSTCFLIGSSDLGRYKSDFAAAQIRSASIQAKSYPVKFEEFGNKIGKEIKFPETVVNCLDSVDARHSVQDLWPDLVIDGAIGDFSCQVSIHPWKDNIACLRCLYKDMENTSAEVIQSRGTGLSTDRVRNQLDVVTDDDVQKAPEDKKTWLKDRMGQTICSVIEEGVGKAISSESQRDSFQPAVPFVATFSASMEAAELVKHVMGIESIIRPRFQLDMLVGPIYGLDFPEKRHSDCICVSRRENIEKIRSNSFSD